MGNDKPPSRKEFIFCLVYSQYAVESLGGILILYAVWYRHNHWDTVSQCPGIRRIIVFLLRHRILHAKADRFTVLVAHLENDTNHEHENLIVAPPREFEYEFKENQVLRLERTISLEGPEPGKCEERGHESAPGYLKTSGTSVLIWGTVLLPGHKTVRKPYWTSSHGGPHVEAL